VQTLVSYPVGVLIDRIGVRKVLFLAYGSGITAQVLLLAQKPLLTWIAYAFLGLFTVISLNANRVHISVNSDNRGSVYGLFYAGVALFGATGAYVCGILWEHIYSVLPWRNSASSFCFSLFGRRLMFGMEVKDVTVSYKKKVALKEASLNANSGEIIGFIGADGAGKSSLMHAIAGVLRFKGEITYDGHLYHSPKEAEKIKPHIGLMPQGIGLVLYDTLTVGEHLQFFADLRGLKQDDAYQKYRDRLLHMAGLSAFTDREAGKLKTDCCIWQA